MKGAWWLLAACAFVLAVFFLLDSVRVDDGARIVEIVFPRAAEEWLLVVALAWASSAAVRRAVDAL